MKQIIISVILSLSLALFAGCVNGGNIDDDNADDGVVDSNGSDDGIIDDAIDGIMPDGEVSDDANGGKGEASPDANRGRTGTRSGDDGGLFGNGGSSDRFGNGMSGMNGSGNGDGGASAARNDNFSNIIK